MFLPIDAATFVLFVSAADRLRSCGATEPGPAGGLPGPAPVPSVDYRLFSAATFLCAAWAAMPSNCALKSSIVGWVPFRSVLK